MHRTCQFILSRAILIIGALLALLPQAFAANGTWTNLSSENYPTPTNWAGGIVAEGAGFTADFSTLDITSDVAVTLDQALTIGNLKFGDTNTATGGAWTLQTTNASVLTLNNSGPKPQITVNPLVPFSTFNDAFIGNTVAGAAGFSKLGAGVLTIGGTGNTITGGINIDAGTLRLQTAVPNQAIAIAGGATLETNVSIDIANGTVPAGGNVTVRSIFTGTTRVGGFTTTAASGATMNMLINNTGRFDITRAWTGFSTWNIIGDVAGRTARLNINDGNFSANGNLWQNAALTMDNVTIHTRTNSNGNTVPIGSLAGTATATLRGGEAGTAARYEIGALNTSTTFSGTILGTGGISINKVGTGTLTLAGTFSGSPALGGAPATPLGRQGGVFRVTAGTLAITGVTSIPGGVDSALTTIDVLPGATFNVSGAPGTFATSTLQKLQGGGTVVGNYDHPAGFIRPGDVGAPTPANENQLSAGVTPTAGTLTFNGNLSLSGGSIVYDMTLNPAAGNDLITVNGTTALTGGKIIPNFLAGVPAGGVYTVLTSTGGFTGPASNLTVDAPGRAPDVTPSLQGNNLVFTPAPGGTPFNLTWRGNNGPNWDEEITVNWVAGATPERFFQFDNVTFDDTALSNAVTVVGDVRPGSVTINSTTGYTFTGTGAIRNASDGAPTGLTKTGAGLLTMNVNNSFSGPASITGDVVLGTFGAGLGTGALTLTNSTVTTDASLANSSMAIPAGTTSTMMVGGAADTGGTVNVPTLTGAGTLTITSAVDNKWFAPNAMNAFTGTLNIRPTAPATLMGLFRLRGGNSSVPNGVVNLDGITMVNQNGGTTNAVVNFPFGELHGAANVTLDAFTGGSTAVDANWVIGNLNTTSDFAGNIINGDGSAGSTSLSHVTKIGTGTFDLTGAGSTYTGNTAVFGGTLHLTNPILPSAAASKVYVNTGGILNLDFVAEDAITALILNGVSVAPGVWGSATSGAPNTSPLLAGSGTLLVGARLIPGDFDGSGQVNSADLTVFQAAFGATRLGDADGDLDTDGNDFMIWQRNLGMSGTAVPVAASVPEPTAAALAACCLIMGATAKRRRSRQSRRANMR